MMFSAIGVVAAPLVGASSFVLGGQAYGIEYLLVPVIGLVVLIYGIAGGLRAAYFTDLVQGCCIILLSVLLIPFGLAKLVEQFGDPQTDGLLAGFRIMHEQLPPQLFHASPGRAPRASFRCTASWRWSSSAWSESWCNRISSPPAAVRPRPR